MKNWQQRWFVLRGDQLLYYKDEDEAKPQVRNPSALGCKSSKQAVTGGNVDSCPSASDAPDS